MIYDNVQEKYVPKLKLWITSDGQVTFDQKFYFKGHKFNAGKKKPKFYYKINTEGIRNILVHRLVAENFCENPCPEHFNIVDHIDGDTENNNSYNLRWINSTLNNLNSETRNVAKRFNKYYGRVCCNKVCHKTKLTNNRTKAYMDAQILKTTLFRNIYRSFITNETETTKYCEHIYGLEKISPVALEFDNSRIRRSCFVR